MTPLLSNDDLRRMPLEEMVKEVAAGRLRIAKIRLGITLQKEKDTAKLRKERRALARLLTVLRRRE